MTDMVESARLYETEMLEWFQVKELFEESGCVVSGKPEIRWYQESWGCVKESRSCQHHGVRRIGACPDRAQAESPLPVGNVSRHLPGCRRQ